MVVNGAYDDLVGVKGYILAAILWFRTESEEAEAEMQAAADFWNLPLYKVRLFYLSFDFLYLMKGHPVDDSKMAEIPLSGGCSAIIG